MMAGLQVFCGLATARWLYTIEDPTSNTITPHVSNTFISAFLIANTVFYFFPVVYLYIALNSLTKFADKHRAINLEQNEPIFRLHFTLLLVEMVGSLLSAISFIIFSNHYHGDEQ